MQFMTVKGTINCIAILYFSRSCNQINYLIPYQLLEKHMKKTNFYYFSFIGISGKMDILFFLS